ncbi:MAG: peptidoglycan bridge formation glycyltransferase FemA/FemB family protein [Armatimonadetes bacterium]|nr:peptidoglycan bridge formation glycyltransferase FemA/FemB family protein [Anaerolineae bacterium]
MLHTITPTPIDWDTFVLSHPRAHVLQLSAWGEHKTQFGWHMTRLALQSDSGAIVAGAQVLLKPLPARLGTMAYLPMGPLVTDAAHYPLLWTALQAHLTRQYRAAFLKIEPGIYNDSPALDWSGWGFSQSSQTVQPPRTILVDLRGGEDAILARMNQGTRRKIRQSLDPERGGVRYFTVEALSDVGRFAALMQTTGERNDFGIHTAAYYEQAFALFDPAQRALILAEHDGDLLAGVMVFAAGKTAWYLYGASANDKRNLMASYGAQWLAMRWARERGCEVYDLWGIPDADEATLEADFQTRSDGLWGVYGFKRGWGGVVARSDGAWDVVYQPIIYAAYQAALRWRGARE